jgi:hydrogenase maturation factor
VPEDEADGLLARIRAAGDADAAIIGRVTPRGEQPIRFE